MPETTLYFQNTDSKEPSDCNHRRTEDDLHIHHQSPAGRLLYRNRNLYSNAKHKHEFVSLNFSHTYWQTQNSISCRSQICILFDLVIPRGGNRGNIVFCFVVSKGCTGHFELDKRIMITFVLLWKDSFRENNASFQYLQGFADAVVKTGAEWATIGDLTGRLKFAAKVFCVHVGKS